MPVDMQPKLYQTLEAQLSQARLDAYRRRLSQADDLDVLAYYCWNTTLSRSLYGPLQAIEIALRNRLHSAFTDIYGTERWFADPRGPMLTSWHRDEVTRVLDKLVKRDRRQLKLANPAPPGAGRVVAELNFGFWVGLFGKSYDPSDHPLWHGDLIIRTFPHIPQDEPHTKKRRRVYRTRHALSARLNRVLGLRNRVFHHEPIWYWQDPPIRNLGEQHNEIMEILGWIDPLLQDFVALSDDFANVYGTGPQPIRADLERFAARLNLP